MDGCQNKYGDTGFNNACNQSTPSSPSVFYFISTIAAMILLGTATALFFCCIYCKRRRDLRNLRNGGPAQPAVPPAYYYWRGASPNEVQGLPTVVLESAQTGATTDAEASKSTVDDVPPFACVIMAGEERPTFLAQPLPKESVADVNLDCSLDKLEKGTQRKP